MILSVQDRLQFQYLLPVQGSLKTLELTEAIISKVKINNPEEAEKDFSFEDEEIMFLKSNIELLDKNGKLTLQSLPVIRKIMEESI